MELKSETGGTNSERGSDNSRHSPKNPETPRGCVLSGFFVGIRGQCCPFFSRIFSGRPSPFTLRFFRVLSILGFFAGGFFATRVLGHELRVLFWRRSCLTLGVRFCMDYVYDLGSSSFRRFRVLLCLALLFLRLLPPFFSWGRPGFLFSSSVLCAARTWSTQAGPA